MLAFTMPARSRGSLNAKKIACQAQQPALHLARIAGGPQIETGLLANFGSGLTLGGQYHGCRLPGIPRIEEGRAKQSESRN